MIDLTLQYLKRIVKYLDSEPQPRYTILKILCATNVYRNHCRDVPQISSVEAWSYLPPGVDASHDADV